jgi:hypothetical protein
MHNPSTEEFDRGTWRAGITSRGGLVVASIVGLGIAALLAMSWKATPAKADLAKGSEPVTAPDITAVPQAAGARAMRNLGAGSDLFVQMADKADPTRVMGELSASKSTPMEGKRYRLEKPRVWNYLRDGRTIYLEADSGQALIPDLAGSRPEDGAIQGHVIAKVFAPTPNGQLPDPATSPALLTLTSDELKFDLRSGEFRFPGELLLTGEQIDFKGSDVLILANEATQQLELLRVEHTEHLVLRPQPEAQASPVAPGQAAASSATPAAVSGASPAAKAPAPVETCYEVHAGPDVTVKQAQRSLKADAVDGFFRLVNNHIRTPQDPKAGTASMRREAGVVSTVAFHAQPASQGAVATAPASNKPTADEPIALHWSGTLEVKPTKSVPDQLTRDEIFVRCSSVRDAGVVIEDRADGSKATGRSVEYFATTRAASISGSDAVPAHLSRDNAGQAVAVKFSADPTTGRIHATGAGYLEGQVADVKRPTAALAPKADPAKLPQRVSWSKEADFQFFVNDGKMTSRLDRLSVSGDVVVSDGVAASSGSAQRGIAGDAIDAEFAPIDAEHSSISKLAVKGHARGWDVEQGSVDAGAIDVTFELRGGTSSPVLVGASGGVTAKQRDSTLTAASLEAKMGQPAGVDPTSTRNAVVLRAVARGDAKYTREDGIFASSPQLVAEPPTQIVTLSGPGSSVGLKKTFINGNTISLNGEKRSVAVEGSGSFSHEEEVAAGAAARKVLVSWAQSMTFEDRAGMAVCTGSASGELSDGAASKDSIKAQVITVAIAPAQPKPDGAPGAATEKAPLGDASLAKAAGSRQVLWADAKGGADLPASIELRRYGAVDASKLLRLMYLEGAAIHADAASGTIDVPSGGKLLAMDRDSTAAKSPATAPTRPGGTLGGHLSGDSKGTALFSWKQRLAFDRTNGKVEMHEGVTMTHKALTDGLVTQLRCDLLTAEFTELLAVAAKPNAKAAGPGPIVPGAGTELRNAVAHGSVWLAARDSEMIAQDMVFDATNRIVDAKGTSTSLVTVTGRNGAAPISAEQIIWNLSDDSFKLLGASPIVAPR